MDQTVRALVFTRCPRRRPSAATRHIGPAGRQVGSTKIARLSEVAARSEFEIPPTLAARADEVIE